MKYNPEIHNRKSIRIAGYDYSAPGAYFITICTHDRELLFGDMRNGKMELNEFGRIARDEWIKTAEMRPYKSSVTKQIKILNENPGMRIWQRNYYEHIIRDDVAYFRIREYIRNNPLQWIYDSNNPSPKNH